jgi:hypothetical protein
VTSGPWLVLLLCLIGPGVAAAQNATDDWAVVKSLTHRAKMTFVQRDRTCVVGTIVSVNDQGVTVKKSDGSREQVAKDALLRIDQNFVLLGTVYNAGSSWTFVQRLAGTPQQPRIQVTGKCGQISVGKLISADGAGLTMMISGRETTLPKSEVAAVHLVRLQPPSDSAAYADDELVFLKVLDPELWPYMFHTAPTIRVRLYDASIPEDNSLVECTTDR